MCSSTAILASSGRVSSGFDSLLCDDRPAKYLLLMLAFCLLLGLLILATEAGGSGT